MVTKDQIAQLKAERSTPNATLEYTIGGATEAHVKTTLEARREYEIMMAERAMEDAQRHMEQDQVFSSLDGLSQAHFNNPKQEI